MNETNNHAQRKCEPIIIGDVSASPFLFFNADNMEIMKQYPDKYFDLAIVDPEYGIDAANLTRTKGVAGKSKTFNQNIKHTYKPKDWDKQRPQKEYFDELQRVSKNQIVWGGNYFADLLPPKKGWIFWDKKITNANNKNFSDGELAWTSFNCILRRFTYDWIGFGYLNNPQGEKKIHPTQKPVSLYRWILENYAEKGFKILDTHLGSGSIALAIDKANKLDNMNLEFVGIELDTEYFNAAVNRFRLAHAQSCLSF